MVLNVESDEIKLINLQHQVNRDATKPTRITQRVKHNQNQIILILE
jgi:hypothetical protein